QEARRQRLRLRLSLEAPQERLIWLEEPRRESNLFALIGKSSQAPPAPPCPSGYNQQRLGIPILTGGPGHGAALSRRVNFCFGAGYFERLARHLPPLVRPSRTAGRNPSSRRQAARPVRCRPRRRRL